MLVCPLSYSCFCQSKNPKMLSSKVGEAVVGSLITNRLHLWYELLIQNIIHLLIGMVYDCIILGIANTGRGLVWTNVSGEKERKDYVPILMWWIHEMNVCVMSACGSLQKAWIWWWWWPIMSLGGGHGACSSNETMLQERSCGGGLKP